MTYRRENDARGEAVVSAMRDVSEARRVLDLGASDGWLSAQLAARGHHVTAVERSRPAQFARGDGTGSIEWITESLYAFELRKLGRFDVTIALSVLHNYGDSMLAWRKVHAMARDLTIVEIPDPEEGTTVELRERWGQLYDDVIGTPGARVVLWTDGWKPGTRRPLVVVPPPE